MPASLSNFDFSDFWSHGEYANSLSEAPPSQELIAELEKELGYRIPPTYIELCRNQNGGLPRKCYHDAPHATSYCEESYIEVAEIYAIGRTAMWALGREGCDTAFWVNECEYPPLGIYFANSPNQGHQVLALDYRECGPKGEPSVVFVDEIENYRIVPLATDFATFIRGLRSEVE